MDSAAEQLFSDITDKDGWTYEALIEGLVKVSATMCLCHADHSWCLLVYLHSAQVPQKSLSDVWRDESEGISRWVHVSELSKDLYIIIVTAAHTQTYNLLFTSLLDISEVSKTWTKAMVSFEL